MFLSVADAILVIIVSILVICLVHYSSPFPERLYKGLKGRFRLEGLPSFPQRQFVFGHCHHVLGLSPEELFLKMRDLTKESEDVTAGFSPIIGVASVKGPNEIEAIISQSTNLDKASTYMFLKNWLGEGLLTCKSDQWQAKRKMLTPAFHFSILREFVNIFNKNSRFFVQNVEKYHLNKSVDVVPLVFDFTLAAIGETSLGTTINHETKEGMDYKDAIYQMSAAIFKRIFSVWLWFEPIFSRSRYGKMEASALSVLHGFTNNIIKTKSQSFKTFDESFEDGVEKRNCSLIDILLNKKFKHGTIDDADIRNEVDTFVFAGHDTSAMCINYTMMLLACHRKIQDEVYEEILSILGSDLSNDPSYGNLQEMHLLDRCIKESLRLYPPVPTIGRNMGVDIKTKYGTIPKGVDTFIPIYDLHRDPRFWLDPERFDPSRFLPENIGSRPTFAYIPFSAGPRNCIGQRFAMLEIKAFFCGLLRKFVLEPVDTPDTLVLTQEIILRPMNGVKVKFILRQI